MKIYAAVAIAALMILGTSSTVLSAAETVVTPHGVVVVRHHPRRKEVRRRLSRQERRINADLRSGKITQRQAEALRRHDRAIHAEAKNMAAQDGGHLTQGDKRVLNQQLNQNSQDIKRDQNGN